MKIVSRAATVGVTATAVLALLAPAASAHSSARGQLKVCVHGLDSGDEAGVDIAGPADWSGEYRGCATFRTPAGRYDVDVDAPNGYRVQGGDDDRRVRVFSGERTTVRFCLADLEDGHDERFGHERRHGGHHWDGRHDGGWHGEDDGGWHGEDGGGWHGEDDGGWHGGGDGDRGRLARVDRDGECPCGYEPSGFDEEICVRD